MTDGQDERIERLQDHALKTIFGPERSARRLRGEADLETLRERRENIVKKFAITKCSNDPALSHWFPQRQTTRVTRNNEPYLEEKRGVTGLKTPLFFI